MPAILGLDPGMDGSAILGTASGIPMTSLGAVVFRDYTLKARSRGREYDHVRLAHAIETLCAGFAPTCVLEIGRGQPGAASSSLAIGLGHGLLLGMIAAYRWPVVKVQPATWHRALFGKGAAGLPKERALAYVRDRWPMLDATLDGRFRKPHQGIIDAACLVLYGRRETAARMNAEGDAMIAAIDLTGIGMKP